LEGIRLLAAKIEASFAVERMITRKTAGKGSLGRLLSLSVG
jgi:hypothetical protein